MDNMIALKHINNFFGKFDIVVLNATSKKEEFLKEIQMIKESIYSCEQNLRTCENIREDSFNTDLPFADDLYFQNQNMIIVYKNMINNYLSDLKKKQEQLSLKELAYIVEIKLKETANSKSKLNSFFSLISPTSLIVNFKNETISPTSDSNAEPFEKWNDLNQEFKKYIKQMNHQSFKPQNFA